MKKSTKGEVVLSGFQIQATRLNKVEYRRLQHNVNLMNDDLKIHLAHLQRQAQDIRHHYANVVRFVKPNPRYQLWKQLHAYEIAQDENKTWLELMKLKRKSKSKIHQQNPSSDEVQSETPLPLLVLLGKDVEKPVESLIDFNGNFRRPGTSPVRKSLPDPHRKIPLWAIHHERPIKSSNLVGSNQSERDASSFLPSITSPHSRKFEHIKSASSATQKTSNLDALYRIALQNQTAYKYIEQAQIEKPKLLDKQFATQPRAMTGTTRLAGLVK